MKEIAARFDDFADGRRTLVLADPSRPLGLLGIVHPESSRNSVMDRRSFFPSTFKGIARGSARSIHGFDLQQALARTSGLLLKWGGHKMAAGLTLSIDKLDAFADEFENAAAAYPSETFIPAGRVDMPLPLDFVGDELFDTLDRLEPHGYGNPRPTFAAGKVRVNTNDASAKGWSTSR
ncbi:MAG: DHHA1 domain-containing protein [Desulfobacterales bacterium]|nr:DHHA1 domain-containing protein [Desulfobacterales bacterium]